MATNAHLLVSLKIPSASKIDTTQTRLEYRRVPNAGSPDFDNSAEVVLGKNKNLDPARTQRPCFELETAPGKLYLSATDFDPYELLFSRQLCLESGRSMLFINLTSSASGIAISDKPAVSSTNT